MKRWLLRIIVVVALVVVAVGLWKREEITRLMAVNTLFDEGKIVGNFSNMNTAFLWAELDRGDGPVTPLPPGAQVAMPRAVQDWIEARDVTSLLVLKDGAVVVEQYWVGL